MLSPTTLAELQDVLDAVDTPIETENGVLTVADIKRLREATEREVTELDPTPPASSEPQIEEEQPMIGPEAVDHHQQRREV